MDIEQIIKRIRDGDKSAVSRAISLAEGANDSFRKNLLTKLYPLTGKAQVVGITGPPGIGKSTLIGNLASALTRSGIKTSILAIDASSPFTGGSLLGNRIRMQESIWADGIYMRSLANRGAKGGLSQSTLGAVNILDAYGSDVILIETVGAGQADLDIMNLADTTILVLAPNLGDQIQAIKAGIMEIADLFVINKMDIEGSYFAMKDIEETLSLEDNREFPREVIGTSKDEIESYKKLMNVILKHRNFLNSKNKLGFNRKKYGLRWILESEISEKIISPILRKFEESNGTGKENNIYIRAEEIISSLKL